MGCDGVNEGGAGRVKHDLPSIFTGRVIEGNCVKYNKRTPFYLNGRIRVLFPLPFDNPAPWLP